MVELGNVEPPQPAFVLSPTAKTFFSASGAATASVPPAAYTTVVDLRHMGRQHFIPLVDIYRRGLQDGSGETVKIKMKLIKKALQNDRLTRRPIPGQQQLSVEKVINSAVENGILIRLPKVEGVKLKYMLNPAYTFLY